MKQTDIYTEALICLRSILLADHPEFQNWIGWLERDIQDWNQRREVTHHLRAYGGMGSFNDLPSMHGNHDYIFDFLKSVCYAFGHLYGKREGISPEALMEECLHDVEQAAYHPVSYTHLTGTGSATPLVRGMPTATAEDTGGWCSSCWASF